MTAGIEHAVLMDRVYRRQRHFYDATRKFYLLGRDPMLAGLKPPAGSTVLEIGCGTGRNLVRAASLYPDASFFGVDISREMLSTAGVAIERAGQRARTRLALADAAEFDPARVFGQPSFDRIFISYAVSMIPQWRSVIANAATLLAPRGELHVVDFGDLAQLPVWSKTVLQAWLRLYHVTPRTDLFRVSVEVARGCNGAAREARLHRGYAWISVIRKGEATPESLHMPQSRTATTLHAYVS